MTEYQIRRKVLERIRKNPNLNKFLKQNKALTTFVNEIINKGMNAPFIYLLYALDSIKETTTESTSLLIATQINWEQSVKGFDYWQKLYLIARNRA